MRKKLLYFLITVIICTIPLSIISFAHSGKTDSNGGHYDRGTGEYHYHHGYPAHQHPNGECPYDFENRETPNYNGDSSYDTDDTDDVKITKNTEITNPIENTDDEKSNNILKNIGTLILKLICLAIYSIPISALISTIIYELIRLTGTDVSEHFSMKLWAIVDIICSIILSITGID